MRFSTFRDEFAACFTVSLTKLDSRSSQAFVFENRCVSVLNVSHLGFIFEIRAAAHCFFFFFFGFYIFARVVYFCCMLGKETDVSSVWVLRKCGEMN